MFEASRCIYTLHLRNLLLLYNRLVPAPASCSAAAKFSPWFSHTSSYCRCPEEGVVVLVQQLVARIEARHGEHNPDAVADDHEVDLKGGLALVPFVEDEAEEIDEGAVPGDSRHRQGAGNESQLG